MPSAIISAAVSGGQLLVSGNVFSGTLQPVGGVLLRLASSGVSPVYIGLPSLSGTINTITSGGTLSSGGLADAMELYQGNTYFVPKTRLVSGIQTIRVLAPAGSSGARLFWENQ